MLRAQAHLRLFKLAWLAWLVLEKLLLTDGGVLCSCNWPCMSR